MMTKGPWEYAGNNEVIKIQSATTLTPIAFIGKAGNVGNENWQNAQAISAVPDMIEVLEQLADDKGTAYWTPEEVRQIAQQALVKAGVKP